MDIQSSPCSWQPPPPHQHRRRQDANTITGNQPHRAAHTSPQGSSSTTPHVELPEDVLQHIHSLMTMRDAARAACASRAFLRFWRRYPNLAFTQETLAASRQRCLSRARREERGRYVFSKAGQVLGNHSGVGVTTLKLNLSASSMEDIDTGLLDGWLRAFVKPGLATLAVSLPEPKRGPVPEYIFPYSLLSHESNSSTVEYLYLSSCAFHPTQQGPSSRQLLGCSRTLATVCLRRVCVTGDELGFFLSGCLALESLELCECDVVASLEIPRALRKLAVVRVRGCRALAAIESYAPNLSTFAYDEGRPLSSFTLGDSLQTKALDMHATRMRDMVQYAGSNLPTIAPNLETLVLSTHHDNLTKAPAMGDKFQRLKHLAICLGESGGFVADYDFFYLAFFLDACVALETFTLRIADGFTWKKKYIFAGQPDGNSLQSQPQEVPELRHGGLGNLRKATITGFCSTKSLVELTCYILESAVATSSLRRLVLDTSPGYDRKRSSSDRCWPMCAAALRDAQRALDDIRRCIEPKVPAGVELKVLGPCSKCHAMDAKAMEEAESKGPHKFLQRQEDGRIALVISQRRI